MSSAPARGTSSGCAAGGGTTQRAGAFAGTPLLVEREHPWSTLRLRRAGLPVGTPAAAAPSGPRPSLHLPKDFLDLRRGTAPQDNFRYLRGAKRQNQMLIFCPARSTRRRFGYPARRARETFRNLRGAKRQIALRTGCPARSVRRHLRSGPARGAKAFSKSSAARSTTRNLPPSPQREAPRRTA